MVLLNLIISGIIEHAFYKIGVSDFATWILINALADSFLKLGWIASFWKYRNTDRSKVAKAAKVLFIGSILVSFSSLAFIHVFFANLDYVG